MSFGENVGFYRRQLSITQEELAERLFVSRQTVSRWETDSTFPDVETVIKLCDIFGCSMDTLVRGNAQGAQLSSESDTEKRSAGTTAIEKMEEELKRKRLLSERIIGAIAGTMALLTTLAYLLCGFLGNLWHPMWLLFIGFGILVGASSVVVDGVLGISHDQKRISYEKKKMKNPDAKNE